MLDPATQPGSTTVEAVPEPVFDMAAPDNGNPRKHSFWRYNRAHFSAVVAPSRTRGLEIGAFDVPMIEPEEGRCDFADVVDDAALRDEAGHKSGHARDFVVPVTYSLRDGYDGLPRDYDWIAASHVVEHIPDVLGWLKTLADHLKPGGVLFLIVPDKRYIFDIHRQDTTFAQVVARHRAGLTRPSFEQVLDAAYNSVPVLAHDVWVGNPITAHAAPYAGALREAEQAERAYTDAHCSVFTPESFSRLVGALIAHDLVPFRLNEVRGPIPGGWDFTASLIRT